MELGVYVAIAMQSSLSNLMIFLAAVSLTSWVIVGITAIIRAAAFMRYRRMEPSSAATKTELTEAQ